MFSAATSPMALAVWASWALPKTQSPMAYTPGMAGLIAFVHQQPFPVQRRGQPRGKQAVEIRPAANGAQHLLAGDGQLLALLLQMDAKPVRRLLHRLHHGGGQHLHALLFQDLRQILSQLTIQLGQQIGHALHQRYLTAKMTVKRGEFHADNAAADDDDGGDAVLLADALGNGELLLGFQLGSAGADDVKSAGVAVLVDVFVVEDQVVIFQQAAGAALEAVEDIFPCRRPSVRRTGRR